MKETAMKIVDWWRNGSNANGKVVAIGTVGWFLGLLTALGILAQRGALPVLLAAAIGWQARAQEIIILNLTNTPSGSNGANASLVCGLFYAAGTCVAAGAGVVCIIKIKRAADCIASNQNWKITNAMQEAQSLLPTGSVPCLSFVLVTLSAFEANWTLETSSSPGGPWTPAAEWSLPANLDAEIAPRTVWLPPAAAGYFRMKGTR